LIKKKEENSQILSFFFV